jgi:hypothetical protein
LFADEGIDHEDNYSHGGSVKVSVMEMLGYIAFHDIAGAAIEKEIDVDQEEDRRHRCEGPSKPLQFGAWQREGKAKDRATNARPERTHEEEHAVAIEYIGEGIAHGVHGLLHVAHRPAPGPAGSSFSSRRWRLHVAHRPAPGPADSTKESRDRRAAIPIPPA